MKAILIKEFGGTEKLYAFISKNFKYPEVDRLNNTQGKIYISFVINKKGKVEDIIILRGVSKTLDEEAIRIVKKMPKWKPGKEEGKLVKVRFNLPIVCKLN